MGDWYVNRDGAAVNLDRFVRLYVMPTKRGWAVFAQEVNDPSEDDSQVEGPFDTNEEAMAAIRAMAAPTVDVEVRDGPTELDGQLEAIASHALRDRVGR